MESAPILVALIAVAISLVSLMRTRGIEEKRRSIEVGTYVGTYYSEVRSWAGDVIDKMTDAVFLCDLDPKKMPEGRFFEIRHQLLADLSSLLDRGRLYIPNVDETVVGTWKQSAYRGLREDALNCLTEVFKFVKSINWEDQSQNKPKRREIVNQKREFTSQLQVFLDVRKIAREIKRLANEI